MSMVCFTRFNVVTICCLTRREQLSIFFDNASHQITNENALIYNKEPLKY